MAASTEIRQLGPESFIEIPNTTFLVCPYRFRHACNDWRSTTKLFRDNSPVYKLTGSVNAQE
jgi:hypothetical protein